MGALKEFLRRDAPGILAKAEEDAKADAEWAAVVDRLLDQMAAWVRDADPDARLTVKKHSEPLSARAAALHARAGSGGSPQIVPPVLEISLADRVVRVVAVSRSVGGVITLPDDGREVRPAGRVDFTDGSVRTHTAYRVRTDSGDEWYLEGSLRPAARLDRDRFEAIVAGQLK